MGVDIKGHIMRRVTAKLLAGAVAVSTVTMGFGPGSQPVMAQGKDLSDNSIKTLMDYAWAITPAKFTLPSGKEIIVDLNKREVAMIPLDTAREVVKAGRLSANAQICGLREEQGANYQTLMAREQAKTKWSDQQLLFISQLHLLTVMMLTGKVSVVSREGDDKTVVVDEKAKAEAAAKPAPTCSDTERQKVAEQINAYLKAEPATAEKK